MTMSATPWPASPLAAADAAFTMLTCEPAPLTLDLDEFDADAGLPGGVWALPALRDWLLARPRAYTARDTVWRELIRRARLDGPGWVIAAVGMAMPALRRYARQLSAGYPGDPADIDAEILTGFLTALRDRVDLERDAPHAGLCAAAWRAGHRLRHQASRDTAVDNLEHVAGPRTPRIPYGHPDLLVRRAVHLGLLDAGDEQPYIDVRLGRRAVEPIAAGRGVTVDALRMRLRRIDDRITAALASGLLTGAVCTMAAQATAAKHRHRPGISRAAARRGATPAPRIPKSAAV